MGTSHLLLLVPACWPSVPSLLVLLFGRTPQAAGSTASLERSGPLALVRLSGERERGRDAGAARGGGGGGALSKSRQKLLCCRCAVPVFTLPVCCVCVLCPSTHTSFPPAAPHQLLDLGVIVDFISIPVLYGFTTSVRYKKTKTSNFRHSFDRILSRSSQLYRPWRTHRAAHSTIPVLTGCGLMLAI